MPLNSLVNSLQPFFLEKFLQHPFRPCRVFLSASDMKSRAITRHASDIDPVKAFETALEQLKSALEAIEPTVEPTILRADWVTNAESVTWEQFLQTIGKVRRNFFRRGLALRPDFAVAFTELELNANLMLYKDGKDGSANGVFRPDNSSAYCRQRFGCAFPTINPSSDVIMFDTAGVFVIEGEAPLSLDDSNISPEHRTVSHLDADLILRLIRNGATHLAGQVKDNGCFVYGIYPCFDRLVASYNSLRHFGTIFSMLDVYETCKSTEDKSVLRQAIAAAIDYGVKNFVRWHMLSDGTQAAYIAEPTSGEIKLGAAGSALLALSKFTSLFNIKLYVPLMTALSLGVRSMQNDDGSFVHVLNSEDYTVKEKFRTVFYDGEAVFGMMRLYSITKDERLLAASELAFKHFIATEHWKNHDHWLSYAANELTKYRPQREYFEFGINNFLERLHFVYHRETQFATLMELMMAADEMLERLKTMPEMSDLLSRVNFDDFYAALEARAKNMLDGYFYPELAMFFKRPESIVGSFFMRNEAFRVRIDDIEHFLSGLAAYQRYLAHRTSEPHPSAELLNKVAKKTVTPSKIVEPAPKIVASKITATEPKEPKSGEAEIFFAGDVVLARRMHWRAREVKQFQNITAMTNADLRVVNLESVISVLGEQGIEKGEGGPFYYRARPEQTNILIDAHIDVALTGNNHTGDYGNAALMEQQNYLDQAGIIHVGSGKNLSDASRPVYVKVNDLIIAIFSVDATMKYFAASDDKPGVWYIPISRPEMWRAAFADRIADARKRADLVFIAPHWGVIGSKAPTDAQKAIGHLLIDLGADAILGCHSHQLYGVEKYRERPIIYDAGNFLFEVPGSEQDTGCFSLTVDRNGVKRVIFTAARNGYGYVVQATRTRSRDRINDWFSGMCKDLGTEPSIKDGTVEIDFLPHARPTVEKQSGIAIIDPSKLEHHRIEPLSEPRPEWIIDKVPEDAAIGPCALGSLKLIGYRVPPECRTMTTRHMLYVETYWTIDEPIDSDCRLLIEGKPTRDCAMPDFGARMEHDFCDWMWPVKRWKPGIIYREKFGLRPPQMKQLENVKIRVEISVTIDGEVHELYKDPHLIELQYSHAMYYRSEFPDIIYRSKPGQCWNAEQLAAVIGGRWAVPPPEGWFVKSVVRMAKHLDVVPAPALYVASSGDSLNFYEKSPSRKRPDTHKLLKDIINKTAGAIVEHYVEGLPADYPQLVIKDTTEAIIALGLAARRRFNGKLIAITGTVGKSSVSAMLECALQHKKCVVTLDNYNTRVGGPVHLARLPQNYDYAIIEVAQSALWPPRGALTLEINPDVSIITRIGMSQTSNPIIKTIEDAAKYKSRVFQGLTENGIAIYPDDLACIDYVEEQAKKYASRQIVCGSSERATSKILEIKDVGNGHDVRAVIEGEEVQFSVTPYGMASVMNMMLVLSAIKAVGEDVQAAIERLSHYHTLYGRLEGNDVEFNGKNIRVIDDSWNATVLSFERALQVVPHMKKEGGRLIGALGRIVNLGKQAKALHQGLRDAVVNTKFDYIVTHGDEMMYLREVLPTENLGPHFSDAPTLVEHLKTVLRDDDTILLKGSRRDSDFYTIGLILVGKQP